MAARAQRHSEEALEAFRVVERGAPGLAVAHLVLGCCWCVSLSIGAAVEGAFFALLVGLALVRLPRTLPLYASLLRTWVFAWYAAWVLWQMSSNLWSVVPVESWVDALLPRRAMALLALWPVAVHWRTLLGALCAGALMGAAGAAVAALWHGRMGLEAADLVIAKYRSSAGPLAAVGIATATACMLSARSVRAWLGALAAQGLLAFQLCALAGRAAALAAVAAVFAVLVRAPSPTGALPRRMTILALAAGAVVAAALTGGPLRDRFAQMGSQTPAQTGEPPSNIRMVLWEEAWERGLEHPIVGHGVNAWRFTVGREMAADPAQFGIRKSRAARLSQANHAHNTLLGAWYGTGIVGVLLLLGTFVCILRSLWRASRWGWAEAAALGAAAVYCVDGVFDDLGNVSVGGFLVALLVVLAAVNGPLRVAYSRRR